MYARRWVDFKINDYMFTNIFFSCDAIHYNILKKYLHVVKNANYTMLH